MNSVELFVGAGGLAMGVSVAGFTPLAMVELDKHACQTIRGNQQLSHRQMSRWPLFQMDVHDFDYSTYQGHTDLLVAGPPCQPWSLGGQHRGNLDRRNLFPEVARAVRELRPKAFIIENVKGLLRSGFRPYYEYIVMQLRHPEFPKRESESWERHMERLEVHAAHAADEAELSYKVSYHLLNAADYGVPQVRHRVFIVGYRSDLALPEWEPPFPTHSRQQLMFEQWTTGEYWDRHGVSETSRPSCPTSHARTTGTSRAWVTVRDALRDLPDPRTADASAVPNHTLNPGARSYPGHTGSPLDQPSKTLKAGVHGVPGGENTVVLSDGSIRYYTVREAARIQTFPDDVRFFASWTENMRQIGNAVPVQLAKVVARDVQRSLTAAQTSRSALEATEALQPA